MSSMEANLHPEFPGSRLDADHPENGVLISCRSTVSKFKELVGVPADKELDILESKRFEPLNDAASITIEKHEVFVSHARTGGSS